jgi:hypothetical protein
VEDQQIEGVAQRFHAEPAEQLERLGCIVSAGVDDSAEAPRIVQPQQAARCLQVEVIVRPGRGLHRREQQAARHAQVQQQHALVQVEQQVLAAAAHARHRAAHQLLRLASQRPAQGFAHAHAGHGGARDTVRETQSRHLDFGQFRHRLDNDGG